MTILDVSVYNIINWFYIYSFLGWVFESTYVSLKQGHIVNRGFITGPLCTIYGAGAVLVYLILKPLDGNVILIYAGGVVVPTILEYFTGTVMENIFKTSWWDYSEKKFNYKGRICLSSSIAWGFFTVALFLILQPAVVRFVALYSVSTGQKAVMIISLAYVVDFTVSAMATINLTSRLAKMELTISEFYDYIKSTRVYQNSKEFREKIDAYRNEAMDFSKLKANIYEKVNDISETAGSIFEEGKIIPKTFDTIKEKSEFYSKEFKEKLEKTSSYYITMVKNNSFITKRFIIAYPKFKVSNNRFNKYLEEIKKTFLQRDIFKEDKK